MKKVTDLQWTKGMTVDEYVSSLSSVGFQGIELAKASDIIIKMKKEGVKIFLTFTSNMVTSGLRGFFAQIIEKGLVDAIVTTVGGIEEDIMKSQGQDFLIGDFSSDDVELYEKGVNRIGNLFITNESYEIFEDIISKHLQQCYQKKARWAVSDMLHEIGTHITDEHSILSQAAAHNVPIFCPAITDGAFGFHLYMIQQKHKDFVVDVVQDFKNILFTTSHDDKKGLISLGGSVSKHHALLACLLNGGLDYAVYMTTAHGTSGSMSGANTNEAKSWGKVKDDSDIATVIGDVTITFPLVMIRAFEQLDAHGFLSSQETDK